MQKTRHISVIICLIVLGLVLSGCGKVKQERDEALAEAAAAKAELAKVETQLAEAQTALDAANKDKADLDSKVADLTTQRDNAIKASEQASLNTVTMLAKMGEQATQHEKQIHDLQAKIKELTDKLKAAGSVVPNR